MLAITRALAHRGPHGEGLWDGPGVTLGHRRLAIVDLSDRGAQPMTRGPLTLVYNGELYNHRQLRSQLGDHRFSSGSDTEVVLAAWLQWGPAALDRFDGMYAFALYDQRTRRLYLVRDRLGIKPLYYHRSARFLLFASEVAALLHSPRVPREPDLPAWYRHLLCSSTLQVDRQATLLAGIRAVPAATCLTLEADGRMSTTRYWTLPDPDPAALTGPARPLGAAAEELADLFGQTVTGMRMGDVPVAAFLSGGLDSSAITAAAAASGPITALTTVHANQPVVPDTDAGESDDLRHSRILTATHPDRIEHHVSVQPPGITLADLDAVCDPATITEDPRHLGILGNYRAVADRSLRVVLNGQGADETMAGYVGLPTFVEHILDVRRPSPATIGGLPASRQAAHLSADVLAARDAAHEEVLAFHRGLPGTPLEAACRLLTALQVARVVQFEDHLAMRAGVEARFPFLAHRLVEWCFTGPYDRHVQPSTRTGKAVLRAAVADRLPAVLLRRPKQVFPHPHPARLRTALAALIGEHAADLSADPLVAHLFRLPPAEHLARLPTATLWLLLMTWRWHTTVQATATGHPTRPPDRPARSRKDIPVTTLPTDHTTRPTASPDSPADELVPALGVTRLAGHIGAQITGVDVAQPLADTTIAQIRAALLAHKVIFFRGQHLDHATHLAFASRFGQPTRRPGAKHGAHPDGYPQILTIDPDADDIRYGRDFEERYRGKWTTYTAGWHTDLTPAVNPPAASILRAQAVPPYGGDTQWTNLAAAYAGLPAPLQEMADHLRAEHAFFAGCQLLDSDPQDVRIRALDQADPQVSVHPVVRVHPETGERVLFVNPASTTRLIGLNPVESRRLLDLFFAHIARPEYTVRFSWQPGSVAFWDNRATAHLAATDIAHIPGLRRTMFRVTLLGDRPVGPDGYTSQITAGQPMLPWDELAGSASTPGAA